MNPLYSRSPDVLWRSAGDRVLLRSLDRTVLMILDGSGTLLWKLLADPISFDDLVAGMTDYYQVDIDLVSGPVARALDDLERANLVRSEERGAAGELSSGDTPNGIAQHMPAAGASQ